MKMIFSVLSLILSCVVFAQPITAQTTSKTCGRCKEIAELEKKVIAELSNQMPDTAAFDVEAAKIINSLGVLSEAQAEQILRYLKFTLPTDPSQAMIESIWPTISANWETLENAAKTLSKEDAETVWVPIQHYANSLKYGRDPARSSKKSKKSKK